MAGEGAADDVYQHPVAGGAEGLLPQRQDHGGHGRPCGVAAVRRRHRRHHVDDGPGQPQQLPHLETRLQVHALPFSRLHRGRRPVSQGRWSSISTFET